MRSKDLPDKDSVLEVYWAEYNKVYANWEAPSLGDKIVAYGLNLDGDISDAVFQDKLEGSITVPRFPQWKILKKSL